MSDSPVPSLWVPVAASVLAASLFALAAGTGEVARPWAAYAFLGLAWIAPVTFGARALTGSAPVRWLPALISAAVFGYLWLWLYQAIPG